MDKKQKFAGFTVPIIDVAKTSKKLKEIREKQKISISELQQVFNMQNPQSIYTWENPESKYLPCIDNFVTLSKLYKVSIDELIILKEGNADTLSISDLKSAYGLSEDTINYLNNNSSKLMIIALRNYFAISI